MKKRGKNKEKFDFSGLGVLKLTWKVISIGISLLMLLVFALFFVSILGAFAPDEFDTGNVAVIPIEGAISTGQSSFLPGANSKKIVKLIKKAQKDDSIEAIILEINSPGGSPVATDEIASAVKRVNKTTVSVIREAGASGAFWIATAADRVYANRMSMTGSIGVTASRLEFAGLIADYNVTYRSLKSGRLKDAGSRFREMTSEEEKLFQDMMDNLHNEFIKAVAENRNLPEDFVRGIATGFVYLGSEAKELGLVDELGGRQEALDYLEELLDIEADDVEFKERAGLFGSFSGMMSEGFYNLGRGMGSMFNQEMEVSFT